MNKAQEVSESQLPTYEEATQGAQSSSPSAPYLSPEHVPVAEPAAAINHFGKSEPPGGQPYLVPPVTQHPVSAPSNPQPPVPLYPVVQPTNTTVFVSPPLVGPKACIVTCPVCYQQVKTTITVTNAGKAHAVCFILCILCCCLCSCLPYCMSSFKITRHECPNCKAYLGTYKP